MNGSFSAEATSLGQLLSGARIYEIPGFQRPYGWTVIEVTRVLDDILFELPDLDRNRDKAFFLGTIVLIKKPDPGDTATGDAPSAALRLDIVDGQQRLATLTMLIAVLRDLASAEGDAAMASRLDHLIAIDEPGRPGPRTYRVNLRASDEAVFRTYIKEIGGCLVKADPAEFEGAQRDLVLNRNYLLEELHGLDVAQRSLLADFLEHNCQVVVISTDDIDNAFRIFMVVNQQGKPLSRNDLLKAELIGAVPPDRRDTYVDQWEAAEKGSGDHFEQLFSHVRTALGNGRMPIVNEIRRIVEREGGGQQFLDRYLLPLADVHAAMLGRASQPPANIAPGLDYVRALQRLPHTDWMPPALLWIQRNLGNAKEIFDFLAALDRTAYAHLLLGLGRDKRIARYAQIIDAIRAGKPPHADRGPMSLNVDERRNILFNSTNDLYERSTSACKLLLFRINDFMGGRVIGFEPSEYTIEHILPQKVGRSSKWRQSFSDSERSALVGSLGNLVLVRPETNKAAGNLDFDKKIPLYAHDPEMRRLPANLDVLSLSDFGPEQLLQREARMRHAMRDLWGLDAPPARRLAS